MGVEVNDNHSIYDGDSHYARACTTNILCVYTNEKV